MGFLSHMFHMNATTACILSNMAIGVVMGVVATHALPCVYLASRKKKQVKVGDKLPATVLYEGAPDTTVTLTDLCKGKKVVIVGVPGAFTPTCSKTHLPGFAADSAALKAKGVDEIVCVSVNDPFVMQAWGQAIGGDVRYLADMKGELAAELGLVLDATGKLGNKRNVRFALVAEDGVVTVVKIEEGGALTCSKSSDLLAAL
mmetsp:Transcript_56907/g.123691  ORF Transcript_56907/g.123691 Transcript_56907/m.123691 type:complete len:202 (-) Transcript_56907:430-1035(-)